MRGWLTRRADPNFSHQGRRGVRPIPAPARRGSIVVCVDEKTAISARSRKHPEQPCRPGRGWPAGSSSTSAMAPSRSSPPCMSTPGRSSPGTDLARNDSATFIRVLDHARRPHRPSPDRPPRTGQRLVTHLEGAPRSGNYVSTHTSTPHYTPAHASWLDQAELFFSVLTRRLLRRGEFTSRQDLADKIENFHHRLQPAPPSPTDGPTTADHSKQQLTPQGLTRSCTSCDAVGRSQRDPRSEDRGGSPAPATAAIRRDRE